MKFKHCIALLALVSTSLFAQTGWVPGHPVEHWAPVTTTNGNISTVINDSSVCPVQIVSAGNGIRGTGDVAFVVSSPLPDGSIVSAYPATNQVLNAKFKNNSNKDIKTITLMDAFGLKHTFIWADTFAPGKVKKQFSNAGKQGLGLWVDSIMYADYTIWKDPNFGNIQKDGQGSSCYYRKYDIRAGHHW